MTDQYQTYRCTTCPRIGRDFAFDWLMPMTIEQAQAGLAGGTTLPDPLLIEQPVVMCPQCKGINTVIDAQGQPASIFTRPPHLIDQSWAELQREKRLTRALRAQMATGGRGRHGGVG